MTHDEVDDIVLNVNHWSFKYGVSANAEYYDLRSDSSIGCKGEGETKECYLIDEISVRFYNDQVICISIQSPNYAADGIDPYVKEWARFSLKVLKKKFGNPSKTNLSIDKFNILSVQSGYSLPLYIWDKKDETVKLAIGSYKFEYYAEIEYSNRKAYAKIEREKRKIKSEM